MTPEQASALATVAVCADIEYVINEFAEADGRVPVLSLLQALDVLRESTQEELSGEDTKAQADHQGTESV